MKVYWDLLFLLNFSFDFFLLLSVSIILRRRSRIIKIILGALFGAFSVFLLFFNINTIQLFFIKILISVFMCTISFSFKNFKYFFRNMAYLYMSSIILGGFLYLLNIEFSYKQSGLVFYHSGLSINFIILIFLSPIIIYLYIKQALLLKNNYSSYYKLNLYFKNGNTIFLTAFLDTGNKLTDPLTKKPIILVSKNKLNGITYNDCFHINYTSLNNNGVLNCVMASCINIVGMGVAKNIIVGISEEDFHIDGVDCILNTKLMEELC